MHIARMRTNVVFPRFSSQIIFPKPGHILGNDDQVCWYYLKIKHCMCPFKTNLLCRSYFLGVFDATTTPCGSMARPVLVSQISQLQCENFAALMWEHKYCLPVLSTLSVNPFSELKLKTDVLFRTDCIIWSYGLVCTQIPLSVSLFSRCFNTTIVLRFWPFNNSRLCHFLTGK